MRSIGIPAVLLTVVLAAGCGQDTTTTLAPDSFEASRSAQNCQNVTLSLVGAFETPTTGSGTFTGALEGTMAFEITQAEQRGRGATHFLFTHTFTTDDGSFTTSDVSLLTPSGRFNERLTIVGGTGIYAGAWGFLTAHGWIDTETGTGEVTYRGHICT